VPFVEGQHVECLVAAGEHDDRRVRETDVEIAVGLDDLVRDGDVGGVERFETVGAARHFGQQRERCVRADARREEVVELGEDEGREQERSAGVAERCCRLSVLALA
jgi:hypothetical protein